MSFNLIININFSLSSNNISFNLNRGEERLISNLIIFKLKTSLGHWKAMKNLIKI